MLQRNPPAERLLLLSLTLEQALIDEDWMSVNETLAARSEAIASSPHLSAAELSAVVAVEERILDNLRQRLSTVRADMRNLNAALRTASGYLRSRESAGMSIAS